MQAQHEEAVRTAVTSERFKVELISNVSHDLRTPLTSILGYSELLQKETLTQEGQEQLRRLHQKAGYMNDLVESLFELTKVSSGVVESKKEQIDLVRLMEQTIGRTIPATFLAAARQGVFFIPAVLILPLMMKLLGIQAAQSVADILSFISAVPIQLYVMKTMDRETIKGK